MNCDTEKMVLKSEEKPEFDVMSENIKQDPQPKAENMNCDIKKMVLSSEEKSEIDVISKGIEQDQQPKVENMDCDTGKVAVLSEDKMGAEFNAISEDIIPEQLPETENMDCDIQKMVLLSDDNNNAKEKSTFEIIEQQAIFIDDNDEIIEVFSEDMKLDEYLVEGKETAFPVNNKNMATSTNKSIRSVPDSFVELTPIEEEEFVTALEDMEIESAPNLPEVPNSPIYAEVKPVNKESPTAMQEVQTLITVSETEEIISNEVGLANETQVPMIENSVTISNLAGVDEPVAQEVKVLPIHNISPPSLKNLEAMGDAIIANNHVSFDDSSQDVSTIETEAAEEQENAFVRYAKMVFNFILDQYDAIFSVIVIFIVIAGMTMLLDLFTSPRRHGYHSNQASRMSQNYLYVSNNTPPKSDNFFDDFF